MSYIILTVITLATILFMYINYVKSVNEDLKIQKENLQTKIKAEKEYSEVKGFRVYQEAKKDQIKKDMKKENNEKSDINLSVGTHDIGF